METEACPDGQQLLDYVLGRLDEERLEVIATHVDHCARCETLAQGLDGTADSLMALLRASKVSSPFEAESELQLALQAVIGRSLRKSASNWTAARLPEQFGRYRIIQRLGAGGMGSVFLAWDTQLSRNVALKIPHFFVQDRESIRERFMREARLAAQIEHTRTCRVYDVGELDGLCFLAMEYVEGVTLEKYAGDDNISVNDIVRIIRIVAETMQELHDQRIVHRDLKPSNVILRDNGEPVIMDFGLARAFDDELAESRITVDGMLVGSPAYMSPEQAAGKMDRVHPASDIYSLGAILFELLTGTIPFQGNVAQVLSGVLNEPPPVPSSRRDNVPAELDYICLRALQKDPEARFASMSEFAQHLKDFEEGRAPQWSDAPNDLQRAGMAPFAPATVRNGHPGLGSDSSGATPGNDPRGPSLPPHRSTPISPATDFWSSVYVRGMVGLIIATAISLIATRWWPDEKLNVASGPASSSPASGMIEIRLDHPDDPEISLEIDGYPIDINEMKKGGSLGMEIGKHYYGVKRNGRSIGGGEFWVYPGMNNPPVLVKTIWDQPAE